LIATYLTNETQAHRTSNMISKKLLIFGPLPIRILAGIITFIAHGQPKFEDITGTRGDNLWSISFIIQSS
jgi:hypothetical protein